MYTKYIITDKKFFDGCSPTFMLWATKAWSFGASAVGGGVVLSRNE